MGSRNKRIYSIQGGGGAFAAVAWQSKLYHYQVMDLIDICGEVCHI